MNRYRTIPETAALFEKYAERFEVEAHRAADPQQAAEDRGKADAYRIAAFELLHNTAEGQEAQTMEISRDTERRWQEKLDAMRADGDEPRQMTAAEAVKEYVRDFGTPSGSAEPTQEDIETILFQ